MTEYAVVGRLPRVICISSFWLFLNNQLFICSYTRNGLQFDMPPQFTNLMGNLFYDAEIWYVDSFSLN